MNIKFTTPKILALFLPAVAGMILVTFIPSFQPGLGILNLLLGFTVALVLSVHAKMGLDLCKQIVSPSVLYKINLLTPAIFFSLYFLYVAYLSFAKDVFHIQQAPAGPIRMAKWGISAQVIVGFLLHAFITFVFITNGYASVVIKALSDPERKKDLQDNYLQPMRTLVRLSGWVFLGFVVFTFMADISKLFR